MLEKRLNLILKNFMKLLCFGVFEIKLAQLFDAANEKLKLFEDLLQDLDILVINRLVEQVVEAEPTGDHQHQALV
jgi:hypothetical protein